MEKKETLTKAQLAVKIGAKLDRCTEIIDGIGRSLEKAIENKDIVIGDMYRLDYEMGKVVGRLESFTEEVEEDDEDEYD
jgi:hypothetical protein